MVEEPGQRIIREQTRTGGQALPWLDMAAFLRQAIDVALEDYATALGSDSQWVFFDRGLIDAAAALQVLTGDPVLDTLDLKHRYHSCVFMAPPWPEIYVQNDERRHDMDAALSEFKQLQQTYPTLGYAITLLPKISMVQRADFVVNTMTSCTEQQLDQDLSGNQSFAKF